MAVGGASAISRDEPAGHLSHDARIHRLGTDEPAHQPIEQLRMLRAAPNLNVFCPADISAFARDCVPSSINL
ncbi:hypothetical protein [Rhizobium tropici]|uniref:hypothetical protein n=1 Tax=Rhizobium tropici TaxID=398 RepID=UPI003D7C1CC9